MSLEIDAFIGRENARSITLETDGVMVPASAITRVVMHIDGQCLDTAEPTDPIELIENATKIRFQLGLWAHATAGTKSAHLVVYDPEAPNGLAWPEGERITINFHAWDACPA
jgi:hypothetical protein